MDNTIVLTPVPLDQLVASITASVMSAIRSEQHQQLQEKLLSSKEVAKLFNVTTVTISSWIGKGLLITHSKGGRNYFKYSEVMDSMKTLKKYKIN